MKNKRGEEKEPKKEKHEHEKNHQTLLVSWFTISNAHVYVCDTSA